MAHDTAIKILLVDDNENNLMSMEIVLNDEYFFPFLCVEPDDTRDEFIK